MSKKGSSAKRAWQAVDQVTWCGTNDYAAQGDLMLRNTLSDAKTVQRSDTFNQNFCKCELISKRTKMISVVGQWAFLDTILCTLQ
jgi:hypothetical protein